MTEKKTAPKLMVQKKTRVQNDSLKALLTGQGFNVQEEAGVGLSFLFEGGTYYLPPQEDDAEFYHLLYPNFWEWDSDEELGRALFACDLVNREGKLVKLHTVEGDVWAGIEALHGSPAEFMAHLLRYLGYLQESVRAFRDVMLSTADMDDEDRGADDAG